MPGKNDVEGSESPYHPATLDEQTAARSPFEQFRRWFEEMLASGFTEPHAVNLATVSRTGEVSSRMVLLKAFDEAGFVFFTNYNSSKARDLHATRTAALCFWWDKLYRQVRISGQVEKIPAADSAEYFRSRPRGSQLGTLASQQSQVIGDYSVLEQAYRHLQQRYQGQEIPCPEHWGGYRIIPDQFEFWQGRPNRLHDRLRYTPASGREWKLERLSP